MDDVELANLIAGISDGPVLVGRLSAHLARAIDAVDPNVYLSKFSFQKQEFRHKEITFEQYRLLPFVIAHGTAVVVPPRTRCMVFACRSEKTEWKPYQLVIKAAVDGCYVQSFHRINEKERRRLLKRGRIKGKIVQLPDNETA